MNGMYFLMSATLSADFTNAKNGRYQKKIANKQKQSEIENSQSQIR